MTQESVRSVQVVPDSASRQIEHVDLLIAEHDNLAPDLPVRVDWGPPSAIWSALDSAPGWRVHLLAQDWDFANRANRAMRDMKELFAYLMGLRFGARGWADPDPALFRTRDEAAAFRAGRSFMLADAA